jgi:hypothetical protein
MVQNPDNVRITEASVPVGAEIVLSTELLDAYDRHGIIAVPLPEDLDALRRDLIAEMGHWLDRAAGSTGSGDDLPVALTEIARTRRADVGLLYKISRRFPTAKQMASHPWLVALAGRLMRTSLVSCCHFVNIRIDLPGEEKYLLPPHQDFPYIQGSLNGVTVWLPLFDTPIPLGPPSWVPGSHLWGVLPVEEVGAEGSGGSGAHSLRLKDEDHHGEAHRFVSQDVPAGTALVFSTLLLHRSQPNTLGHARVNCQLRFDDALAVESRERNYPEGLFLKDGFSSKYPEYVA